MSSKGTAGFPAYRTETFDEVEDSTYEFPQIDTTITLAAGQNLKRLAVLGQVTATGQWVLSLAAANDGSEVPRALLAFDVNAAAAAAEAKAYIAGGRFVASALTIGAGHTVASVKAAFATRSLFLVENVI